MLAHSPPLPLVIDYYEDDENINITAEDEEAIILALEQRDRVRRIRFCVPVQNMQNFIRALDGEYPLLEYLILASPNWDPRKDMGRVLALPEALATPHLRHLFTDYSIIHPIRSQLRTIAVGLVVLHLQVTSNLPFNSSYFRPTVLHQWLPLMPQLKILRIFLNFPSARQSDAERHPMTPVTLPNLRFFALRGVSAYSEEVLSRITAPRLASRFSEFPTSTHARRFPFQSSCSSWGEQKTSGSTVPVSSFTASEFS